MAYNKTVTYINPPVNVLRKYLFFPIYDVDVLIDIEKYREIIIRGRIFKKCKRKNINFFSLII
jgi:hypothetical protein